MDSKILIHFFEGKKLNFNLCLGQKPESINQPMSLTNHRQQV